MNARNIWNEDVMREAADSSMLIATESRLNVTIPEVIKDQFIISNGGELHDSGDADFPLEELCYWTNATVTGLLPCQHWRLALVEPAFERFTTLTDSNLLVILAFCVESYLCVDYRKSGRSDAPAITYLDVSFTPPRQTVIAKDADQFINALLTMKYG